MGRRARRQAKRAARISALERLRPPQNYYDEYAQMFGLRRGIGESDSELQARAVSKRDGILNALGFGTTLDVVKTWDQIRDGSLQITYASLRAGGAGAPPNP